jgi:hypothetical protein
VAHNYNPSYLGGRDQRLKPAPANSSWDPILKIPITKRVGRVTQGKGPEFKPAPVLEKKTQGGAE